MQKTFTIITEDEKCNARVGRLKTRHGTIKTPFFMPVATRAVGKFIGSDDYAKIGADAIISNSFILSLNPGVELIKKAGGIHKFMNFNKVIFTDCGGFQRSKESIFLGTSKKGLHFESPFDRSRHLITPEKIMRIQMNIRSDVAMMLDDMAPPDSTREQFVKALKNTHKWAEESLEHHTDKKQLLFGIVQGGFFKDLRENSAKFINNLDFNGVAIGGLAIGEPREKMYAALKWALPHISKEKPHYLMGVGSPLDLLECISLGIDCFDSAFPTQNARHDTLFTWKGTVNLNRGVYKQDFRPIDDECDCFVCKNYSRAYIHYLSKSNDPVAKRYKSCHNLYFTLRLIEKARTAIKDGEFQKFKREFEKSYVH